VDYSSKTGVIRVVVGYKQLKWEPEFKSEKYNNNDWELRTLYEGLKIVVKMNKKRVLVNTDNDTVLWLLRNRESKCKSTYVQKKIYFIQENDIKIICNKVINKDNNGLLQVADKLSRNQFEENKNECFELIKKELTGSDEVQIKIDEIEKVIKGFYTLNEDDFVKREKSNLPMDITPVPIKDVKQRSQKEIKELNLTASVRQTDGKKTEKDGRSYVQVSKTNTVRGYKDDNRPNKNIGNLKENYKFKNPELKKTNIWDKPIPGSEKKNLNSLQG